MKKALIGIVILLLAGCGGPAKNVKESEGSTAGSRLVMMSDGYIDEAGKGQDAQMSQLNPWVEIDRKSGIAGYMGVTMTRVVADPEIFSTHAPRWLWISQNDEMRINVGNKTVVLTALEEGKRWHKNQEDSAGYRTTTYFETVRFQASASDMEILAAGPITQISVSGQKGGTLWPRQGRTVLKDYQPKFSKFYKENIAASL